MVSVTGLIITKLDGTAKGGVVIGLAETYRVKLHAIGIGEDAIKAAIHDYQSKHSKNES